MKYLGKYPATRLRRVRNSKWIRKLVAENDLSVNDLILPIFVREGKNKIENIKTMPVNVTNKHTLSEWVTNLHNHVNKVNNKPHYDHSTVVSKYNQEGSCKSCSI